MLGKMENNTEGFFFLIFLYFFLEDSILVNQKRKNSENGLMVKGLDG